MKVSNGKMTKKQQTKSASNGGGNGNGNGNGHGKNGNGNGNGHGKNGNGAKAKVGYEDRDRMSAAAQGHLLQIYPDLRQFGGVLAGKGEGGFDAGSLHGPIQLEISSSVNIPHILEIPITRVAVANETLAANQDANQTMGSKWIVNYALFFTPISVNPFWADKTGLTNSDLARFWDDCIHIFDNDASATRPMLAVRKLVIAKHASKRGDCSPMLLRELINIQQRVGEPQSYSDFEVTIGASPTPSVELFVIDLVPGMSAEHVMAGLPMDAVVGNRWDAWLIWEAIRSNPNGDPDNANHPRVDSHTHKCFVTDVCLKRKIRNRLTMVHGADIYVREGSVLSLNRKVAYDHLGLHAPPPMDDAGDEAGADAMT